MAYFQQQKPSLNMFVTSYLGFPGNVKSGGGSGTPSSDSEFPGNSESYEGADIILTLQLMHVILGTGFSGS